MYKEFFKDSTYLDFPLFTLLLFVSVFLVVVLRALFSRRNEPRMQALARLPLEDGPPMTPRQRGNEATSA